MGDEGDQLVPCLVDGLERLDPGLGLALLAALLDDPREEVGDRAELGHVRSAEHAWPLGLDVEHADRLVVPRQRHAQHRADEASLVDAADPQEARVGLDVRDDQRLLAGRDGARDPFAERDAGASDLEAIEPVGRGERQVRSIPVEQIERGHIGMEGVAGAVDDRLEQLVPRAGRGRETRDVMDESKLVELIRPRRRNGRWVDGLARSTTGHVYHRTRVGTVPRPQGCESVAPWLRYVPLRWAP